MQKLTNIFLYFFQPIPADAFQYRAFYITAVAIILIASITMRIVIKKKKDDKIFKKLYRSLPSKLQTCGICLIIYILARYGKIPFLSMRILSYLIFATTIYVILQNVKVYIKDYPEMKKRREEQLKINKYSKKKILP